MNTEERIKQIHREIADVRDFPVEGIVFRDISGLLKSKHFGDAIELMGGLVPRPDYWIAIESRGFIFASALAMRFGGGLVLCRKKNKLPPPKFSVEYELEYGTDILEMQPGSGSAVIVDDVLATGGTMLAAEELARKAGYRVLDRLVLINLAYLNRMDNIKSLISYA